MLIKAIRKPLILYQKIKAGRWCHWSAYLTRNIFKDNGNDYSFFFFFK